MKFSLKLLAAVALALILSLASIPINADGVPSLPQSLYGTLNLYCAPAPPGTIVEARGQGVMIGVEGNPITTTETGKYGSSNPMGGKLVVQGNILSGTPITFWVNGVQADQTINWEAGQTIALDLTVNKAILTILSTSGGSVSRSPEKSIYACGDEVTLTAIPDLNYHFVEWTGNAGGTANPMTITINGDMSITGHFALTTYSLTVNHIGEGTVTKNPDQPSYSYGTSVELSAEATPGWTFTGWEGDLSGTENVTSMVMDADKTVTAIFTQNEYILTIAATNGTVNSVPLQATYHYGDIIELTADPDDNYHFVNWSGDADGSSNPLFITIDGNKQITASFAIDTYTLTVNKIGQGTVTREPDQESYPFGNSVDLTAAAAPGWTFTGWSGDLSGTETETYLVMNGNKTVTATFTQNEYTLTVTAGSNGTVTRDPEKATYHYGDTVIITAIPDINCHFVNWSGGGGGATTNPLTVTINNNLSIMANFEPYIMISFCQGWNILSTPVTLAAECDTLAEFIAYNNLVLDAVSPIYAYVYASDSQSWYWTQVTASQILKPCDAFYVKYAEAGTAIIVPSSAPSVPTKQLYPGWNLVSLAAYNNKPVDEGFRSIFELTGGLPGYSQVVSPLLCGQPSWDYVRETTPDTIPILLIGKGYWVWMINEGTLAGFSFTPQQ